MTGFVHSVTSQYRNFGTVPTSDWILAIRVFVQTFSGYHVHVNPLQVQVVLVTIDPERDTPALLAQYMPAFHPSFLGLSGDTAAIASIAKDFKIFYQKRSGTTPGSYTMDHSTGSYVIDQQGKLRLYLKHEDTAPLIAQDIKRLLKSN